MFLGEYHTKFTGHNRIVLPKKFRSELKGKNEIILSRGFEGCIWGFSPEDWEKEANKQMEIPVTEKEARDLRRYLFSAAESVKLDEQGRFIIPGTLLVYANLKDNVVLIGAGDHFEIWNEKSWKNLITNLTKEVV
ncbi:MAG: division/cell wall cluster transcriptional repressor MraZ [Patescibacteria group bacterium]|nr:division/cell wall cluster transcriptional repressor MraZ [Patescibacteria group bacterium]